MSADRLATVGDITISRVREHGHDRPPEIFFDDADVVARTIATTDWLAPWCVDGLLRLNFQAFVVETPTSTILIDPCLGNGRTRSIMGHMLDTPFLDDLRGVVGELDRIDTVVYTHLHFDHIGWSTTEVDGRWVPTFPGARHLIVGAEWDHWRAEVERGPTTDFTRAVSESIAPLFDHDLVDLVDAGHEVAPGVRLRDTAGHSPGHVAIDVRDGGGHAVITGDLMHHPVQVADPQRPTRFDDDPARAAAVRVDLVDELAASGALLIGTHFAGDCAGYVDGSGAHRSFYAADG